MATVDSEELLKFDNNEEVEATFIDDEITDTSEERICDESSWPKDDPSGYSFKGKKRTFLKIVENLKVLFKKGSEKILGNVNFKILDVKKIPGGLEYEIEVGKNKEKGIAIAKIYGPNAKKMCTILLSKSKKFDALFVQILAIDIIKQLIDRFSSGNGWIDALIVPNRNIKKDDSKKTEYCYFCGNGFCSVRNLRVHIEKYHPVDVQFTCDHCDFRTTSEKDLIKHTEDKHSTKEHEEEQNQLEVRDIDMDIEVNYNRDVLKRER